MKIFICDGRFLKHMTDLYYSNFLRGSQQIFSSKYSDRFGDSQTEER